MIIPQMTLPEAIFGILVLTAFAAFVVTLAGVHLYVSLPRRQCTARATVAVRTEPALHNDHAAAA